MGEEDSYGVPDLLDNILPNITEDFGVFYNCIALF